MERLIYGMIIYAVLLGVFYPLAWGLNRYVVDRYDYLVRYTFWIGSLLPILTLVIWSLGSAIIYGTEIADPMLFAAGVAFLPLTVLTTVASYRGTRGVTA